MSNLTVTDLFCGAGGSSSGAIAVPGVVVRLAANHWKLAIDTHNENHPDTDHDCADLSQVDPRRYPKTDILWASPECTNHSQAKGKKRNLDATPDMFGDSLPDEAADRSRATMWDVPRFAEVHKYRAIVVENVVDAAKWIMWPAWVHAMQCLGYEHQVVYLNSMHAQAMGAPAPQSRDRLYVVLWLKGNPRPDLNRWARPKAWCPSCDEVITAVQAWKNPAKSWGRYRSQYVWRCPRVACRNSVVEPGFLPAAHAIDWTLPGQRIGDRSKPLADKTRARISAGLKKYARPIHLEAAGNTFERPPYIRAWPTDTEPLKTLHTSITKALAYAPAMLVPVEGRDGKTAQPAHEPLRTQTARNETGVAIPPYIVELRGGGSGTRSVEDPLATVTAAGNHHGLLVPSGGTWNEDARPTSEPHRAMLTRDAYGLLVPYYGNATARTTDDPHGTLTTKDRYALVMRNNSSKGDGAEMVTPVTEELRTITTGGHQSLLHGDIPEVDDCHFRMLEPHEIQAAMAFDLGYRVLGNKREKVRQLGNAVTPPAARDLIAAVAESLGVTS
jgi:DNA (cytosine-5)-methyltransferase 1